MASTREELQVQIARDLPTNQSNEISAEDLRGVLLELLDSLFLQIEEPFSDVLRQKLDSLGIKGTGRPTNILLSGNPSQGPGNDYAGSQHSHLIDVAALRTALGALIADWTETRRGAPRKATDTESRDRTSNVGGMTPRKTELAIKSAIHIKSSDFVAADVDGLRGDLYIVYDAS